jgi:hypothetical protein
MSGWKRLVRGILGMGVGFAAVAGLIMSTLAAAALTLEGGEGWRLALESVMMGSLWGFLIGVTSGGVMALLARGQSFESLSLRRFAGLGAGAGLFLFGVVALALRMWDSWSASAAVTNAVILAVLGGGCATAFLLLARKAEGGFRREEAGRSMAEGEARPVLDAGAQVPHPLAGNRVRLKGE